MKNNKLIFIIVSIAIAVVIILIIFLLIVPTQCSKQESITTETETSITEETLQETVKETETRTTAETTAATTAKETTTATETTAVPKEAPTIKLEIYEGPTYSPADNVCYYRIKANVTGSPVPTIAFSKDDSDRTLGTSRCQVNLYDVAETYTLNAKATNSEGYDIDSLTLTWGCELENQNPVISEITVMGTKYISRTYGLGVSASDPDGDSLTYNWSVTGGTIDDTSAQNINWTTPSTYGNYTISVIVSDGKGGEDSTSEDIYVYFLYDLLAEASDAYWTTGAGHIDFGGPLDDSRGFALYRTNIELEDGNTYPKVLETHPRWTNSGWVAGIYSSNITIPDGAKFTAKIGFIKGATATDGVKFAIRFYYESTAYTYDLINAAYDGVLDDLNIDLSLLYGKTGQIQLLVSTGGSSSAQDWAVWVNPQITN